MERAKEGEGVRVREQNKGEHEKEEEMSPSSSSLFFSVFFLKKLLVKRVWVTQLN